MRLEEHVTPSNNSHHGLRTMVNSLLATIDEQETAMFALLKALVLQESYTLDKARVDSVGRIIQEALAPCGLTMEKEKQDTVGDHLIFRSAACKSSLQKPILLVGHMDTVFPEEMKFNWYREDDENVYGPGVVDMKGGLVTAISALQALSSTGLLNTIPITFICNSDEEKGSPTSKELIRREAEKSLLALVFECGGKNGEMVTGRKGKIGFHIDIQGKAGHAAFAGKNKSSSILELAHKTIALEALNNHEKQRVVNVGIVCGGIGPNTVAERAEAEIDCRFLTKEDGEFCCEQITRIIEKCQVDGTTANWTINSSRAVMEAKETNRLLLGLVQEQAQKLNMHVGEELRSGVSDANTIAGCGIPVLDGLGPIGEFDHSDKEYMVKKSLSDRVKITACSLLEIIRRQDDGSLTIG